MENTGLINLQYVNTVIKERPRDIHKGQCGRVLTVAGSVGMAGAAVLCTEAALKSGAGLVKAAVPGELFTILQIAVPQATCMCISDKDFLRSLKQSDAVALGPGMGVGEDKYLLIEKILNEFDGPVVVDADGITNLCRFGKKTDILKNHNKIILTPHPGECDRILESLDEENIKAMGRIRAAEIVSEKTGAVVLLKGADTVVTKSLKGTYINTTGNPGMATGGSGDVLTGLIAAIAASGTDVFDAAKTGAYIHGLAGDIAADRCGQRGMTSVDIKDSLPVAFKMIIGK
ncbi:MAG: NAD(P)H-hydrate dehydratase [Anaerovoracaceae bacterium]